MEINYSYTPKDLMFGLFRIHANRLLIEKMILKNGKIYAGDLPILDKAKKTVEVDAATFECLNHSFFRDKDFVYGLQYGIRKRSSSIELNVIKECDPLSFRPISMFYGQDKEKCFFVNGKKVLGERNFVPFTRYTNEYEDLHYPNKKATLTWMSNIAKGENGIYKNGNLIKGVDAETFQQVGKYYFKDKNNVYDEALKIIERVDVDSFIVLDDKYCATDKYFPINCNSEEELLKKFDSYRKYFEPLRDKISSDYWWFKLEGKG